LKPVITNSPSLLTAINSRRNHLPTLLRAEKCLNLPRFVPPRPLLNLCLEQILAKPPTEPFSLASDGALLANHTNEQQSKHTNHINWLPVRRAVRYFTLGTILFPFHLSFFYDLPPGERGGRLMPYPVQQQALPLTGIYRMPDVTTYAAVSSAKINRIYRVIRKKRPNTISAMSQICVCISAPNFPRLFGNRPTFVILQNSFLKFRFRY